MYYEALATRFAETSELVAFCDLNQTRMNYANQVLQETYGIGQFDHMIIEEKPDVVIVTSIDRTHHIYIIRSMELGCDVITEKPLTVDENKCQATHHFAVVNFWLATQPKTVFAMGDLGFYGRENAEMRGVTKFYARAYGSEHARNDPFALHLEESPRRVPPKSERSPSTLCLRSRTMSRFHRA